MNKPIYLDYAAATPIDPRVFEIMKPYFIDNFYNPSSVYLASRDIKENIHDARILIAHWLGSRPSEIVFTAGATEANNLAVLGVCSQFMNSHVVTSSIEHEAILEPVRSKDHTIVAVDSKGMIDLSALADAINDNTVLVSVIYANNEIGTVQHMADISGVVVKERARRAEQGIDRPIYFHTDASQAANYLDLHVSKLGIDLMTLNSGKTYGPKQVAVLYVRAGVVLRPIVSGGGQEKGIRSGTENVPGIVGFAKAIDVAQKTRKDEGVRLSKLRSSFVAQVTNQINDCELLGHGKHTLPNVISLLIPGVDGERLVMMLDENGFQCATGSACSALSDESSHVIRSLGRTDDEARATLRISMGRLTTESDMAELAEILPSIVADARAISSA